MQYTSVPSGEDIDNLYVAYVGQTVIIIDFYLPWKLLNHEVITKFSFVITYCLLFFHISVL